MKNNKPIGGFLELELPQRKGEFHPAGVGLSNGRTCLHIILSQTHPENVYVPYYCCNSLLSPLYLNNIRVTFYALKENFEPAVLPQLKENELFLYINYFGIKRKTVDELARQYKDKLIIDNSQDYFNKRQDSGWSFNSARKFFGVPDGAYLYSPVAVAAPYEPNRNFIADHLIMRLDGRQQEAFELFQKNESLQNCDPFLISNFSRTVLSTVDYDQVALQRKTNYNFYQEHLAPLNRLADIGAEGSEAPFCYPFLPPKAIDFSLFYSQHIYIPMLWKDVIERSDDSFSWEKEVSATLVCLPVDQRYSTDNLLFIVKLIKDFIQ